MYLEVALAWSAWCALHSGLAAAPLSRRFARHSRLYRLFYNALSLVTLLALWQWTRALRGEVVFAWTGWGRLLQAALLVAAAALFLLAARRYDLGAFLGLRPVRQGLGAAGEFERGGVLGLVRHPWYLALILLLWGRALTRVDLVVNAVLMVYLWVGAWLEERKLLDAYGEAYRRYQREVPMLLPRKWPRARRKSR